jgi:biotin-(acetyl-CoA carboxylase) ligase
MDNDHDILVSLKTLMDVMIKNQADFMKDYEKRHAELVSRVTVLENSDSRDSEKFKGITDEIRRSLNNASKIDTLAADVNNLAESLRDLKAKSNLFDIANAIAVAIAAAVAWLK